MAQRSWRCKLKDERSTEDGVVWNGFECKWLECGTTNCKMWMSMMAWDEVHIAHEVVKCGLCMAKEMNVAKIEIKLLWKEVWELRLQSINKDNGAIEVKIKEKD